MAYSQGSGVRIKILGRYWNIFFKPLGRHKQSGDTVDGLCDPLSAKNRAIWIDSRLTGRSRLETLIHEFIHASDSNGGGFVHSEDYVTRVAYDLSRLLWKLGYRLEEDDEDDV